MSKKFKHVKIWNIENNNLDKYKKINFYFILKYFIIIFCVVLVIVFWKYLVRWAQLAVWFLWKSTVKTVSSNLWTEMIRDDFWNINLLLVGVWGENHHGWYLADTMIVASRNPKLGAVTMISIPRDLYIASTWIDCLLVDIVMDEVIFDLELKI
jgi:anionic cell wall polymer biosynthesis LytR-Cps2A-Psr (LCP) family protein